MKSDSLLFEFTQELYTEHGGRLEDYKKWLSSQKATIVRINDKYSKILCAECLPTKYVDTKLDMVDALIALNNGCCKD